MFTDKVVKDFQAWLGPKGRDFFTEWIKQHGHNWPTAVVMAEGSTIPHPIHLREGMQIRNWMRGQEEFKNWDAQALDESWHRLVEHALTKRV